jgi:aminopeptidase N
MNRFGNNYIILLLICAWIHCYKINAQQVISDTIWSEGVKYMFAGDYLRGIEKMNEYLKYWPMSAYAYNNRAFCRNYLGDLEGFCNDMNKAYTLGFKRSGKKRKIGCDTTKIIKFLKKQFYPHDEIFAETGYRPYYTRADTLRGALRPERTCFDVFFYNLTVRIKPLSKSIQGKNEIWFRGVAPGKVIQIDLFDNYKITRISMEGKILSYRREYQAIFINLPEPLQMGKKYEIIVEYEGKPHVAEKPPWQGGFVWSFDKHLNRWVSVACEYLGASSWWPVKDHLSDRPDSMGINIEVPHGYQAICNGRLRKVVKVDNRYNRYEWFVDYPINNYNATFYMGKYVEFDDTILCDKDTLLARYHVLPYDLKKAKEHFRQARDVVSYYSSAFGPFPFPKDNFRMVESSYEGMEHQTAIAYGEAFSNTKNSETYVNRQFDYIIVHEVAHEWWGNSVAAADMADIWLHEGFATYAEYLFIEHMLGYDKALVEIQHRMWEIFNVWPLVQNHNVNENAFASEDVYTKGAMLLNCLRATIDNDSLFMAMLRNFNLKYRDTTIESTDFINFVNNYTHRDFTPFFNIFLYKTQVPVLEYTYTRQGKNLTLKYRWTGVDKVFVMTFSLKAVDSGKAYRLVATTSEQEAVIDNTGSFLFYNSFISTDGCPHNGLTYFRTKCGSYN